MTLFKTAARRRWPPRRSLAVSAADARAQALEKLTIVIFSPPSLGALLPPVIKAQKFDKKNGLDITFEERPPDAYATQFNSGEFKIGGSASLTTLGLADVRGVKVKYLFNLFDFWGTDRHLARQREDAEGPRRQGARRRALDHELPDVRLLREAGRASTSPRSRWSTPRRRA